MLPQPTEALATRQDTVNYQIPLVENMIIDEMALEGAFEGYRFYDLMRVALRRGDPSYLAAPIARRNGEADNALYTLVSPLAMNPRTIVGYKVIPAKKLGGDYVTLAMEWQCRRC